MPEQSEHDLLMAAKVECKVVAPPAVAGDGGLRLTRLSCRMIQVDASCGWTSSSRRREHER